MLPKPAKPFDFANWATKKTTLFKGITERTSVRRNSCSIALLLLANNHLLLFKRDLKSFRNAYTKLFKSLLNYKRLLREGV
jgi:hypothetical protein